MDVALRTDRLWGRRAWIVVLVLTAIGMVGVGVDFLGLFSGGPLTGGCAMAGVAAILMLLAAAPTAAVVLLFWALLSRGSETGRIADLVVLGAIMLPLAWACISGLTAEVSGAMTPPPPLVAGHVGCGR